jgi:hypothetical protein
MPDTTDYSLNPPERTGVIYGPGHADIRRIAPQLSDDEIVRLLDPETRKTTGRVTYFYGPGTLFRGVVCRYCIREALNWKMRSMYFAGARWLDTLPGPGDSHFLLQPNSPDYAQAKAADEYSPTTEPPPRYRSTANFCLMGEKGAVVRSVFGALRENWATILTMADHNPLCEVLDNSIVTLVKYNEESAQLDCELPRINFSFCGRCGGWYVDGQCRSCFQRTDPSVLFSGAAPALPRKVAVFLTEQCDYNFEYDPQRARAMQLQEWCVKTLTVDEREVGGYHKPLRNISMETR